MAFELLDNPYQQEFLRARRSWICPEGHMFVRLNRGDHCPLCKGEGYRRAFNQFLLRAGRRGGKSLIGAIAMMEEAAVPNTRHTVVTPTFKHIHKYTWPTLLKVIPREWLKTPNKPINETYQELRLINGSVIIAQSAENPEDLRGDGVHSAWFDEACQIPYRAWEVFSPSLSENAAPCWFTTTPQGEDWVHETFWIPAEQGVPGYWATSFVTLDNPVFRDPAKRAIIEQRRRTMTPEMFRQEFEASIEVFTGAIYGALMVPQIELTDAEVKKILPEWPYINASRKGYVGIDPGSGQNHPWTAVGSVATPQGLIVCREYAAIAQATAVHAEAVKGFFPGLEVRYGVDKRRRQDQIELSQQGIFAILVGDAVGGAGGSIERVKTWLHMQKMFFVKSRVPKTIAQMKSYRWAPDEASDGQVRTETPFKKKDDFCDSTRYMTLMYPGLPPSEVMSRIVGGRDLDKDPLPPEAQMAWEREMRMDGHLKREDRDVEELVAQHPMAEFYGQSFDPEMRDAGLEGLWGN